MSKRWFLVVLFIVISTIALSQEQQKEVLLIGTMHQVPKIIKNAYKPLFKQALKYRPEAIYVETAMPNDSLSWNYLKDGYSSPLKRFYKISDSLRHHFSYNPSVLENLLKKNFSSLTRDEIQKIRLHFGYLRDWPNYQFYSYLIKYGPSGSKKALRVENFDLTAKLALSLNHKKVYATDDQQKNAEFHQYWRRCLKLGETKQERKLSRKMNRKFILPSLFGQYGIRTNRLEVLDYLHQSSSLRLSFQEEDDCKKATFYWDERNRRIVNNLGTQIAQKSYKKSLLVIGASHIVGVKNELEKQFPNIKVVLIDDLRKKKSRK